MKKVLLVLVLGLSSSLFAQQTVDEVINLNEVVISATRSEINIEDSPIPTDVIGKKEIEQLNLITMQDLLQTKGYFVAPMKSGGFQLRGLSSEYILVMIDGVPISGRESGALDVSNINLANVERVEIVKGSMSALWGNYAIGGVINIITKTDTKPTSSIITQYGTAGTFLTGFTNSFTVGKVTNSFKVTYGGSDGFDIDDDIPGDNVLPNTLGNLSNKTIYRINNNNTLRFSANYFKKNSRGSSFTETNTQGQLIPLESKNSSQNLILDLSYKTTSFGKFTNELKLSKSSFENSNESSFQFFGQDVVRLDESEQSILQLETINSYDWSTNNQTTFGFGYRGNMVNTERYGGEKDLSSSFAYLQHYISLNKLKLVVGGRYDNYTEFGSNFTPKVSAKYNLGKFSINSSVGTGFRVPDFRTLYINYGGYSQGFYVLGANNIGDEITSYQSQGLLPVVFYPIDEITNLKPETSVSYDFGVDYKINNNSRVGVSVFQTNTNDLIESVLAGVFVNQTLLFGYTNVSQSTFKGVELSGVFQLNNFRFDGNYQYLEASAEKADGTEFFLSERPKHLTNVSVTYTHPKSKITANVNGVIKSDYFFRDLNRNNLKDNSEFVQSHSLLNGVITKKFGGRTIKGGPVFPSMVAGIGVNNILNFTNKEFLRFQQGRVVFVKLSFNINK